MAQRRNDQTSFEGSKMFKLSELKFEPMEVSPKFDHLKAIRTSSMTIVDLLEALITHPMLAVHPSISSTLVMGSSGTFANCEVEGAVAHMDHQVWETCQEVFDKCLFVES